MQPTSPADPVDGHIGVIEPVAVDPVVATVEDQLVDRLDICAHEASPPARLLPEASGFAVFAKEDLRVNIHVKRGVEGQGDVGSVPPQPVLVAEPGVRIGGQAVERVAAVLPTATFGVSTIRISKDPSRRNGHLTLTVHVTMSVK